jgi:DNA-binding MarR family transcriptional regulator
MMVETLEEDPSSQAGLDRLLEPLERLVIASVGLTTVALTAADPPELTLQQWRAIVLLGGGGALHVGDVAARIGISLPSASRLVGRLEERGYVATARDPRDRRGTLVTLTPRGAEVRSAIIERRRLLMRTAIGDAASSLSHDVAAGLAVLAAAFDRYA